MNQLQNFFCLYFVGQYPIVERRQIALGESFFKWQFKYRFAEDFRDVLQVHPVRCRRQPEQKLRAEMLNHGKVGLSLRMVALINDDIVELFRVEDVDVVSYRIER